MMPGCSFLNMLAGSLYGTAAAFPLVALLSTVGASGSYWLSRLVVKVWSHLSFPKTGPAPAGTPAHTVAAP